MINIKFINATSVQLVDQAGNIVQMGEFLSPIEYSYSGNTFSESPANFYHFVIQGSNVQLSGTIGDVTKAYQYWNLFKGQSAITDASNLTLSSSSAKKFCYANMFMDCTNLTSSPTIAATTLDEWCYSSMFAGCVSLTLTPALIAETLAPYCYFAMFYGCKNLVNAPNLPAETLTDWCYGSMFFNCQDLTSISASFTDWNTNGNSTKYWVTGIDTEGTFMNDEVQEIYGVDEIPVNWEVLPQEISDSLSFRSKGNSTIALTNSGQPNSIDLKYSKNDGEWIDYENNVPIQLANNDVVKFYNKSNTFSKDEENYWYFKMTGTVEADGNIQSLLNFSSSVGDKAFAYIFNNCSSLLTPPQLPATTVGVGCYWGMFRNCSNLSTAPVLPATTATSHCYYQMFANCSSLLLAPDLPATGLAENCYRGMFGSCVLIPSAVLPAERLADWCYENMFYDCTNLSYIEVSFTKWNQLPGASHPTQYWVHSVSPTGTFVKPQTLAQSFGQSYIPFDNSTRWTVINK